MRGLALGSGSRRGGRPRRALPETARGGHGCSARRPPGLRDGISPARGHVSDDRDPSTPRLSEPQRTLAIAGASPFDGGGCRARGERSDRATRGQRGVVPSLPAGETHGQTGTQQPSLPAPGALGRGPGPPASSGPASRGKDRP